MADPIASPEPGQLLDWVVNQPAEAAAALRTVEQLRTMQLPVITVMETGQRKQSLIWADTGLLLPLPVALPFPYALATGTLLRSTFDANESTTVSNPPTQSEVEAIQSRLTQTRQIIAALLNDLQAAALINAA